MEHKKDIGKAFREKLDQLDKTPGDHVWAAIEADLPKKKRRRFPFWLFFTSLIVVSILYFGTDIFENGKFGTGKYDGKSSNSEGRNQGNSGGIINGSDDTFHPGTIITDSNAITNSNSDTENAGINKAAGKGRNDGNDKTGIFRNGKNKTSLNENGEDNASNGSGKKSGKKSSYKKQNEKRYTSKSKGKTSSGKRNVGDKSTQSNAGLAATSAGQNNALGETNTSNITGTEGTSLTDEQAKQAEAALAEKDSLTKNIAKKEKEKKKPEKDTTQTALIEEDNYKTFSIFLYAAPTFYNRFSQVSSIDRRLDSISGRTELTFNYGGYLCFAYDEKLSVRVGIAKTKLKYVTQGIPINSLSQSNYYSVEYAGGVSNGSIQAQFVNSQKFDILQEVSYLEFPIELKYKFYDKTIDIEGIGGFSTLFLKQNSLTAQSDNDGSVVMGSTKDMSKAYLSANVGVAFSYVFIENFRLNIEPMFKYHFRTSSTALQPYSVLVQAGIEYTFNSKKKKKVPKK